MSDYEIPNSNDVSPDDIHSGAVLIDADLSEAYLRDADLSRAFLAGADLSGAVLTGADLSGAVLTGADLSGANLFNADLSGATLVDADLPEADLVDADLPEAILVDADLEDADLREADLPNASLSEADLDGVALSRGTNIGAPRKPVQAKRDELYEREHDQIARANHELRTAYSANGLTSRARTARVRERKARRREARKGGGWGWLAWLWSVLAQGFTGYGIQLRWILGVMLLLYFGSALVYSTVGGMTPGKSLYYSIVTFTTSPPEPAPTSLVIRAVAGFETFAGTAAIIFLGYVLGTRERV